jgi:hypothetical protein
MAETSSDQINLTAEEVMELANCRYIDFPGVGVIDLEGPQYSEKGFEVAKERVSNALTIRETLASVSKALQEYESTGGFSSAAGAEDCRRDSGGACGPRGANRRRIRAVSS